MFMQQGDLFFSISYGAGHEKTGLSCSRVGLGETERRNFLNVEVVKHWNELLRESVDTLPLGNV